MFTVSLYDEEGSIIDSFEAEDYAHLQLQVIDHLNLYVGSESKSVGFSIEKDEACPMDTYVVPCQADIQDTPSSMITGILNDMVDEETMSYSSNTNPYYAENYEAYSGSRETKRRKNIIFNN